MEDIWSLMHLKIKYFHFIIKAGLNRDINCLINYKKLDRLTFLKVRDINGELVRKRFLVQNLRSLIKSKIRQSSGANLGQ